MFQFVKNEVQDFTKLWNRFWFSKNDYFSVSLFRFLFFIGLFIFYAIRAIDFDFLFGKNSFLPQKFYLDAVPESYLNFLSLEQLGFNLNLAPWLYALFLLLIIVGILGWAKRWVILLIFILHIVFVRRMPIAIYGADMVVSFWLLYLILSPGNQYFRFFIKTKCKENFPLLASVGIRLIQLQLCIIYAFSGLEKAKGITWWQGDAVWFVMGNSQIVSMDFGFLAQVPLLVVFLTFATILWEVYFPFAIWIPKIRKYVLLFGTLMHLGIGLLMNLPFFAWFMLSAYVLFLSSPSLRKCQAYFSDATPPQNTPGTLA